MTSETNCPLCNAKLAVKVALRGKTVVCPSCRKPIKLPVNSASDEPLFDFDEEPPSDRKVSPSATGSSRQSTAMERSESDREQTLSRTVAMIVPIIGGCSALLVGIAAGWFSFQWTSTPKIIPVAVTAPVRSDFQEINTALSQMQDLLDQGRDRDFLITFAPVEELRKLQQAEQAGREIPKVPRDALKQVFAKNVPHQVLIDANGLTAAFQSGSTPPPDSNWSIGPGYEGDVMAAIKSAIADIERGELKTFIRNMFPPDALQGMFGHGISQSAIPLLRKESAALTMMMTDLKQLQSMNPSINDNVAQFTLPARVYPPDQIGLIRPGSEKITPSERVIRFSLINDHWRFYSNQGWRNAGTIHPGLRLERVGTAWRLAGYP